jgi:hypothetical protein
MNLKIRGRLFLGFGTVLFLLLLMSGWSYVSGSQTRFFVSEADRTISIVVALKDAQLSTRLSRVWTFYYLAVVDDSGLPKADKAIADALTELANADKLVKSAKGHEMISRVNQTISDLGVKGKTASVLKAKGLPATNPEMMTAVSEYINAGTINADAFHETAKFFNDQSNEIVSQDVV